MTYNKWYKINQLDTKSPLVRYIIYEPEDADVEFDRIDEKLTQKTKIVNPEHVKYFI